MDVKEDYPWHEIILTAFGDDIDASVANIAVEKGVRIVKTEGALLDIVHGTYVEWLFPGDVVRPEKLRKMVTCMETQDEEYPLMLSDASEAYSNISPYVDFGGTEDMSFRMFLCESVWQDILVLGKYPSRGLAGLLVRRDIFEACNGLWNECAGGRTQMLSMWRSLLLAGSRQGRPWLGVLRDDFTGSAQRIGWQDIAAHQLVWHALCEHDGALLTQEEKIDIADRQRRVGIYLLEQALKEKMDLSEGIWPKYQQMLMTL